VHEGLAKLRFPIAAARWLLQQGNIEHRTIHDYGQWIATLTQFFGALELGQIHIGNIVQYQQERSRRAGPRRVNQELGVLRRILTWAGLWKSFGDYYERLPEPARPEPPPPTEARMREMRDALEAVAARRPRRPFLVERSPRRAKKPVPL